MISLSIYHDELRTFENWKFLTYTRQLLAGRTTGYVIGYYLEIFVNLYYSSRFIIIRHAELSMCPEMIKHNLQHATRFICEFIF